MEDLDSTQLIYSEKEPSADSHDIRTKVGQLEILSEKKEVFPLYEGPNTIGRDKAANISINHQTLSKIHACIHVNDGNCSIQDNQSQNKTYIGKRVLYPWQLYQLFGKENIITFGDLNCKVIISSETICDDTESLTASEPDSVSMIPDDDISLDAIFDSTFDDEESKFVSKDSNVICESPHEELVSSCKLVSCIPNQSNNFSELFLKKNFLAPKIMVGKIISEFNGTLPVGTDCCALPISQDAFTKVADKFSEIKNKEDLGMLKGSQEMFSQEMCSQEFKYPLSVKHSKTSVFFDFSMDSPTSSIRNCNEKKSLEDEPKKVLTSPCHKEDLNNFINNSLPGSSLIAQDLIKLPAFSNQNEFQEHSVESNTLDDMDMLATQAYCMTENFHDSQYANIETQTPSSASASMEPNISSATQDFCMISQKYMDHVEVDNDENKGNEDIAANNGEDNSVASNELCNFANIEEGKSVSNNRYGDANKVLSDSIANKGDSDNIANKGDSDKEDSNKAAYEKDCISVKTNKNDNSVAKDLKHKKYVHNPKKIQTRKSLKSYVCVANDKENDNVKMLNNTLKDSIQNKSHIQTRKSLRTICKRNDYSGSTFERVSNKNCEDVEQSSIVDLCTNELNKNNIDSVQSAVKILEKDLNNTKSIFKLAGEDFNELSKKVKDTKRKKSKSINKIELNKIKTNYKEKENIEKIKKETNSNKNLTNKSIDFTDINLEMKICLEEVDDNKPKNRRGKKSIYSSKRNVEKEQHLICEEKKIIKKEPNESPRESCFTDVIDLGKNQNLKLLKQKETIEFSPQDIKPIIKRKLIENDPEKFVVCKRKTIDKSKSENSVIAKNLSSNKENSFNNLSSKNVSKRRLSSSKPKVVFTGVTDKNIEKIVKELGGELVDNVGSATHLVTDKVRRTVKFLCAVARGIPIVSLEWLKAGKTASMFVPHHHHLLKDNDAERQYNFDLVESLETAAHTHLFENVQIYVTRNVKPEPKAIKEMIEFSGGKFLHKAPTKYMENTYIVSCIEDHKEILKFEKLNYRILSNEFILTGILLQKFSPDQYYLT